MVTITTEDLEGGSEKPGSLKEPTAQEPAGARDPGFMSNLESNLSRANNIMDQVARAMKNPIARYFIKQKLGVDPTSMVNTQGIGPTEPSPEGAPTEDLEAQEGPGAPGSNPQQVYNQILQGIDFIIQQSERGEDTKIGEVKKMVKENKEMIIAGIEDRGSGNNESKAQE